jgi:hypothetical protein
MGGGGEGEYVKLLYTAGGRGWGESELFYVLTEHRIQNTKYKIQNDPIWHSLCSFPSQGPPLTFPLVMNVVRIKIYVLRHVNNGYINIYY